MLIICRGMAYKESLYAIVYTTYGHHYKHHLHWRQEPFFVARKTITKPSIFVKFVIKFEGATNPIHILSLCSPHNCNWQG